MLAKSRSCVDFAEIVCRFRSERSSRDRVLISPDVRWSLVRVAGGNDKHNLDLVGLVKINCMCVGDSFEGTSFVCWPSRDRVSILPRSCVDSVLSAQAEIVCRFY